MRTIIVNNAGPKGNDGGGTGAGGTYIFQADGVVNGHRVVSLSGTKVKNADVYDINTVFSILGIATNAATDGGIVNVLHSGELTEPTWNWIAGQKIYCGEDGVLSASPPTTGICMIVATAMTSIKIFIKIQTPIIT